MPHVSGETYETAIDPAATALDWGAYVAPGNPFSVGQLYNPVLDPPRPTAAPEIFPTVRVLPQRSAEAGEGNGAVVGATNVPDPEYLPQGTVFEDAPGGIYDTNRAPTDWDWVYEQYVELNQPKVEGMNGVIDWAKAGGAFIGGLFDPFGMGSATEQYIAGLAAPGKVNGVVPQQLMVNPATGQLVHKHKRRRRRRLLTDGDFNDLMRISTLPNKDIVKIALAKAVGR